jgi:hypothetical protein
LCRKRVRTGAVWAVRRRGRARITFLLRFSRKVFFRFVGRAVVVWAVQREVRAAFLPGRRLCRKAFFRFAARAARSHCRRRAFRSRYASFLYRYLLRRNRAEMILTLVSLSARAAGSKLRLRRALFLERLRLLRRSACFVAVRRYGLEILKRAESLSCFARKSSRRR